MINILYGSQMGTAEGIAKNFVLESGQKGYKCTCHSMDEFQKVEFTSGLNLIIVSSTGDGEPPENAISFFKYLSNCNNQELKGTSYALLGLGDSNFTKFMGNPRNFDEKMQSAGSSRILDRCEADDAMGLEDFIEPWKKKFFTEAQIFFEKNSKTEDPKKPKWNIKASSTPTSKVPPCVLTLKDQTGSITPNNGEKINHNEIILAKIKNSQRLTTLDAIKQVIHMELEVENSFDYKPGYNFSIQCPNDKQEVEKILKVLNVDPHKKILLEPIEEHKELVPSYLKYASSEPTTLEYIFTWVVSIRSAPQKGLLRVLADYAKDDNQKRELREVVSIKKKKEYEEFISSYPTLLELLEKYDKCIPKVEHLLSVLPKNPLRNYSFASSPLFDKELHFAYSCFESDVEKTQFFPSKKFKGLCTNWLTQKFEKKDNHALCSPVNNSSESTISTDVVPLILNKSNYFTLPDCVLSEENKTNYNLVFVAAGTGLSPFRGFLRHFSGLKKKNPNFLIPKCALVFGCRDSKKDFLYREEIEGYVKEGILTHLFTSFSRENYVSGEKRYVDKVILENSEFFKSFIDTEHSYIYVCGEANGMVKSVTKSFETVLQDGNKLTIEEAQKKITTMKEKNRYVLDIWI